ITIIYSYDYSFMSECCNMASYIARMAVLPSPALAIVPFNPNDSMLRLIAKYSVMFCEINTLIQRIIC
ncbi:MAG TPA: hypothetical protein PLP81_00765, partial [Saprospiraceae bacterium]|nr:hypothetical protein [Saprospiraceae bacterium]